MTWSVLTAVFAASQVLGAADTAAYGVYVVEPAINNYAIVPGRPLPKVCSSEKTIKLTVSRGEYEPASFVVKSGGRALKGVKVEVAALRGQSGRLPAGSVDVRVVQMILRRVTNYPGRAPWLLVHDPGIPDVAHGPPSGGGKAAAAKGAYTRPEDNLDGKPGVVARLRRKVVDADTLQPVDIPDLRQFWLTVHVPSDAKAGRYRTTVTIAPANAAPARLDLEVTVPTFDLLPPPFEYSVYYPAYLARNAAADSAYSFGDVTDEQYVAELKNMVAHGCTNPNMYEGPSVRADGTLDFSLLERMLRLRRQAGVRRGRLFFVGHPLSIQTRRLTEEERGTIVRRTRQIVDWCAKRGQGEVYFMLQDEASGGRLRGERESIEAIHQGGGRAFVACGRDFFGLVGDLLDLPVLLHPGHGPLDGVGQKMPGDEALRDPRPFLQAGSPGKLLDPGIQNMIKGVHKKGFAIFTYMDPLAGQALPGLHRRDRGLGLWKAGLDGTMTWAYTHIMGPSKKETSSLAVSVVQPLIFAFVWRTSNGVLDTLAWEAYREGADDARYLATLLAAMSKARAGGRHGELVAATRAWLDGLTMDADLAAWRREMTRRIEALLKQ